MRAKVVGAGHAGGDAVHLGVGGPCFRLLVSGGIVAGGGAGASRGVVILWEGGRCGVVVEC